MIVAKHWKHNEQEGVHIWCPGCDAPHGVRTKPRGWTWNGSLVKPTFHPSLLTKDHKHTYCHCFVVDGCIQFLSDSNHSLAGKTVDLPAWPYADD